MTATKESIKAALDVLLALGDAIRELGEVPSGVLYANVSSKLDLRAYEACVDRLVGAGVVARGQNHTLKWVGPLAELPDNWEECAPDQLRHLAEHGTYGQKLSARSVMRQRGMAL